LRSLVAIAMINHSLNVTIAHNAPKQQNNTRSEAKILMQSGCKYLKSTKTRVDNKVVVDN
jgi:hypothetical protein